MSKKAYVGVGNTARNVSKIYVGVDGVARKVIKGYVGVDGVARQFWPTLEGVYIFFNDTYFSFDPRTTLFDLPALAKSPLNNKIIESSEEDLDDIKGLFLAYLSTDTGSAFWGDVGYTFFNYKAYASYDWQIDEANYIYKTEDSTDYRTTNKLFIPISRVYIDIKQTGSVKYFDFKVVAKGQTSLPQYYVPELTITPYYVKDGALHYIKTSSGYSFLSTRISITSGDTFAEYVGRCTFTELYSDVPEDVYIDYICLECDVGVSGLQTELYVQSVNLLDFVYRKCCTLNYEYLKQSHKYINNRSLFIPFVKNSLSIVHNGRTLNTVKSTGNSDVYLTYTYSVQQYGNQSYPMLGVRVYVIGISESEFSLLMDTVDDDGYEQITVSSPYTVTENKKTYYYNRPVLVSEWNSSRHISGAGKLSYLISPPECEIAPMAGYAGGVYYTIPRRMALYLAYGTYYE